MTQASELRFEVRPDPKVIRDLRRIVREALIRIGVEPARIEPVLLVLDEILSNAIEHGSGYREGNAPMVVLLRRRGAELELEFEDPAVPQALIEQLREAFGRQLRECPPAENERGRGIYLVAGALRDVRISTARGGGLHLFGRFQGKLA